MPRGAATLRVKEATLESGLSVVAVRKPGVPLVEMRLRIPFLSAKAGHPAQGAGRPVAELALGATW